MATTDLRLVDSDVLPRPGAIGRITRLVFGMLCVWYVAGLLDIRQSLIAGDNIRPLLWNGVLPGLLLVSYVVNIGFTRAWKKWPAFISALGFASCALYGWISIGSAQTALLARCIWGFELYVFGHLGLSFLLAALLATPGCEMRALHDLYSRVTGAETRGHACPIGPLTYIDAWEAGRGARPAAPGKSIGEILARRGSAEDWELLSDIAAILHDKRERLGSDSLTPIERQLLAIDAMTREVNNGGFHQFLDNPSGEFAYDLVPALEAVGSTEFKELAEEAIAIFGADRSLDEDARYQRLDELTDDGERDPWQHVEERFFVCREPVESLAIDYAIAHRDELGS